ncbi:hypothetical protein ILYODFUR_023709 [Ilyodon furcidens]|uniref:Uncharacterized protein n=1 Tax=Ilyodon furcidens TaxID=33524 RepID=A0ABV0TPS9_9TELE
MMHPRLRQEETRTLCSTMVLYLAPSILPFTLTSIPIPAEEKHPHSMMLSPKSFTIRKMMDRTELMSHSAQEKII